MAAIEGEGEMTDIDKDDLDSAVATALNDFDSRDSSNFYMICADDVDGFIDRIWNLLTASRKEEQS